MKEFYPFGFLVRVELSDFKLTLKLGVEAAIQHICQKFLRFKRSIKIIFFF